MKKLVDLRNLRRYIAPQNREKCAPPPARIGPLPSEPRRRAVFNEAEAMPIAGLRKISAHQRGILKRAQGNAYQGRRMSRFDGLRLPEVLGHARDCQFIAGDPGVGASTCAKPSKRGSSYCLEHHAICYDRAGDISRSRAARKGWETRKRRNGTPGALKGPAWWR